MNDDRDRQHKTTADSAGAYCNTPLQPERHRRRSIRLRGYDYSQAGAYFITVCTQERACLFGEIVDREMRLNDAGEIVKDEWLRTADMRSHVELDAFVVMPNHFHGIIVLHPNGRGVLQYAPTDDARTTINQTPQFRSPSQTVGAIVRGFKSASAKCINKMRHTPCAPIWQRNYYDHVIRNDESLNRIRAYIVNNPLQWEWDRENVRATHASPQPLHQQDKPWRI